MRLIPAVLRAARATWWDYSARWHYRRMQHHRARIRHLGRMAGLVPTNARPGPASGHWFLNGTTSEEFVVWRSTDDGQTWATVLRAPKDGPDGRRLEPYDERPVANKEKR